MCHVIKYRQQPSTYRLPVEASIVGCIVRFIRALGFVSDVGQLGIISVAETVVGVRLIILDSQVVLLGSGCPLPGCTRVRARLPILVPVCVDDTLSCKK